MLARNVAAGVQRLPHQIVLIIERVIRTHY